MKLFWNIRLTPKGLKFRPAIKVGKRIGATINQNGIFPSIRIKK